LAESAESAFSKAALSRLPTRSVRSLCATGTRSPLGERKTCLQVAFLLAQPTKVLLRYFRESNKATSRKERA